MYLMIGLFSWCYFKRISFLYGMTVSNGYLKYSFSIQLRVSGGYQIERLREQMGDVSTE